MAAPEHPATPPAGTARRDLPPSGYLRGDALPGRRDLLPSSGKNEPNGRHRGGPGPRTALRAAREKRTQHVDRFRARRIQATRSGKNEPNFPADRTPPEIRTQQPRPIAARTNPTLAAIAPGKNEPNVAQDRPSPDTIKDGNTLIPRPPKMRIVRMPGSSGPGPSIRYSPRRADHYPPFSRPKRGLPVQPCHHVRSIGPGWRHVRRHRYNDWLTRVENLNILPAGDAGPKHR